MYSEIDHIAYVSLGRGRSILISHWKQEKVPLIWRLEQPLLSRQALHYEVQNSNLVQYRLADAYDI